MSLHYRPKILNNLVGNQPNLNVDTKVINELSFCIVNAKVASGDSLSHLVTDKGDHSLLLCFVSFLQDRDSRPFPQRNKMSVVVIEKLFTKIDT